MNAPTAIAPRDRTRPRHWACAFAAAAACALASSCTTAVPRRSIDGQPRFTRPAADAKKSLTVLKSIAGYGPRPPSPGGRFPPGLYRLEAEDAEYWYLRSEVPLEITFLENRRIVEMRRVPGGIMISKTYNNLLPAAGYVEDDFGGKSLVWELGREFLYDEGRYWTKNF